MARDRFDGTPVPNVHPVRRIMPFVMPTKNGAFVLFEQEIATAPLVTFLADLNRDRPAGRHVTMFHCVLRAIGVALTEFPRLNRYVAGSRLYARKRIELAFSAKQRLERDAPLFTAKVELRQGEALGAFVDRLLDVLGEGRSGKETAADREIKTFLRLPGPLLRAAVKLQRVLDGWNLYPASLLRDDPLYASAFVANLGSVGLDAAYHHLYEYGSIPIFATMGRVKRAPVVFENGSVGSREVFVMRYTYDERVEDGFYAARALERMAVCLAEPATLR
jgi:pyruvate/2-oxoglutarate dehydrogenase complex dihydrolipoamide acyltransferase (E2) component